MTRGLRRWYRVIPLFLPLALCGNAAQRAVDLPGEHAFPESISVMADGVAYVGSVHGGVLRTNLKTGQSAQWIKPGQFGSSSVFGVLADPVNHMLWVCNNDLSAAGVTIAGADVGSYLKGFDLKTGEGKISLALPGERSMCNDMALGSDGALYVTETTNSAILRWRPGAKALENWLSDPALGNEKGSGLDGIAFGGDGNLYVTNFRSSELLRVDMAAGDKPGAITRLKTSQPLRMPDGLRPIDAQRFAMADGAGQIDLVTIDGDAARIDPLVTGLSSATGVGLFGHAIWYVQGELSYIFDPAKKNEKPPLPFRVTPVALPE